MKKWKLKTTKGDDKDMEPSKSQHRKEKSKVNMEKVIFQDFRRAIRIDIGEKNYNKNKNYINLIRIKFN